MDEPVYTDRFFVFVGVYHEDLKVFSDYILLPEGSDLNTIPEKPDHRIFSKPISKYQRVGGIYKVKATFRDGGGLSVRGEATYEKTFPDKALVTRWEIDDRSRRMELDNLKAKDKEMRQSVMFEALDPIAQAYRNASTTRRAEILAITIEFITRGRKGG